ncbi:MAG: Transcriptional repressor NrdR [Candidatus Daviesbacteria bacterium GW2011_GWA1_41_61]|uniref:Transcriptional repressor NrdR n=1 Tax=Candidatus Daviesbacteria bacterium GW2011_GWA2_40_9 TaxID=1618424 RepID=A0A0G0U401_9BACT|nr:MAG: Transcriptional repressor NrdR [Candidatus Daviesbacteria bacterium GW2011_GWA2_40_9]KKR93408.1 MAG: Transcriptional repressor NrdR [Candidatus Daviesbacteria bacterium GW2011_GWB1_41_15]KKS15043.1 MAG: Transcriptional repressor NrdR [Candidatus Daviesbacteria bacterium GW2011_GWA1_41_61]
MECPFCCKPSTQIVNTRPTYANSAVWRRRRCLNCGTIFTTHEVADLSHLVVIKKSGKSEMFSHIKLYSGIYRAAVGFKGGSKEKLVDKITREIEKEIVSLKTKKITSEQIGEIVLNKLRVAQSGTFLRFLAYYKDITNEAQLKRELTKYLPFT